eukprot:13929674-Ditylum_brightwellii.AAC.1
MRRSSKTYLKHPQRKKTEGMCVPFTTTISGSGQVSAIYVTVKGLTQKEIPIGEDDEASKAGII